MKWVECPLAIAKEQLQEMENLARLFPDSEVCGLIYPDAFIALNNVNSHKMSFHADPSDLMRSLAKRGEPWGIFHTHPSGNLFPSESDERGWFYIGCAMVIGTLRNERLQLKAYRLNQQN